MPGADVDHRAPLGELGAEPAIFDQPLAQPVEALGDHLAGRERQRLGALVDLDAGERAGLLDQLDQRRAVLGLLPDGLVVEDDAGNVLRHRLGRAEQHLAIVAAVVGGRFDADGVEALLDGAGGFVGGENAPARRDHGLGDLVELSEVHRSLLRRVPNSPSILPALAATGKGGWLRSIPGIILTRSTSTPGKALPSSHSRKAPPAVET